MLIKIELIISHIVLIPTYGAPEIKLEVNPLNTEILWRMKIKQEKCRNFVRRQLSKQEYYIHQNTI